MLGVEADKQQVYLDLVLERKRQLLEDELPQLCAELGSLQGLDVVKVRVLQPQNFMQIRAEHVKVAHKISAI